MVRMGAQDVSNEDDIGGNDRPVPGRYHSVINAVKFVSKIDGKLEEVDEDSAEKIIVTFEVLAGTVPGQAGKEIPEFFAITEKAFPRLKRLALCVGLLKPQEPEKDVYFSQAENRQLVIEVEENSYENRDGKTINGVRVGFMGLWSVSNPAVDEVPKCAESLKLLGEDGAGAAKAGKASAEDEFDASGQGETVPPSNGKKSEDWGDL